MDHQALRLLGSVALARAARGEEDVPALSVLKLLGSEAERQAANTLCPQRDPTGCSTRRLTGPYEPMNLDHYFASWFERYARSFSGTIAGGTSEIQRNIIAQQVLGLPTGRRSSSGPSRCTRQKPPCAAARRALPHALVPAQPASR